MLVYSIIPIILAMALIALFINLIWKNRQHERALLLRIKKLYASRFFEDLTPMLKTAKKHHIDQLIVDKTGLIIRYLQPGQTESVFLMNNHGYTYLTPEQQEAVRAMLEDCIPKLKDNNRYCMTRKRQLLVNGDTEYIYHYIIVSSYKSMLSRAPYYDSSLKTQLW